MKKCPLCGCRNWLIGVTVEYCAQCYHEEPRPQGQTQRNVCSVCDVKMCPACESPWQVTYSNGEYTCVVCGHRASVDEFEKNVPSDARLPAQFDRLVLRAITAALLRAGA